MHTARPAGTRGAHTERSFENSCVSATSQPDAGAGVGTDLQCSPVKVDQSSSLNQSSIPDQPSILDQSSILAQSSMFDQSSILDQSSLQQLEGTDKGSQSAEGDEEKWNGPGHLTLTKIASDGLLNEWNTVRPDSAVATNDFITEVNGKGTFEAMQEELRVCGDTDTLTMKIIRWPDRFNVELKRQTGLRLGLKFAAP